MGEGEGGECQPMKGWDSLKIYVEANIWGLYEEDIYPI